MTIDDKGGGVVHQNMTDDGEEGKRSKESSIMFNSREENSPTIYLLCNVLPHFNFILFKFRNNLNFNYQIIAYSLIFF